MDPKSAFAGGLDILESARVARVKADDDRVRRAILPRSVPTRSEYPVGAYVYFRRDRDDKHPDGTSKNSVHWWGVARVVGHELSPPERAGD